MKKIICFGEIMLRLSPPGYLRFRQTHSYDICFGGAEANTAVSLANLGLPSAFVTKLPRNDIAESALQSLRMHQVDTSSIVFGGDRVGIYYIEKGASQRPSKVIYDRKHSAMAEAKRSDFDWEAILSGAGWFHFTGITPALGGELPEICMDAIKVAREKGLTVSCDMNYRKSLWSASQAQAVMTALMPYVDVWIGGAEDAVHMLGIKTVELGRQSCVDIARQIIARYGCWFIAMTLRESMSASENMWAGMLFSGNTAFFSREYHIRIVDRVGSGDAFGAGLIYALASGKNPQWAVDFAAAAACLKHSMEYDVNWATVEEVTALMTGDGSGRVQR